jgi:hypothetical protein
MDNEATPSGADINTPAPGTIDEAAQKLSGLFGDTDKPKEKKEKPDTNSESEDEVKVSDNETQEEEAEQESADEGGEQSEEGEARTLTSLDDIEQALGVDRDALMQITIKTKVDGVEQDATLAQVLKNYQLDGHITRKSMEVSDLKKEVEKERESFQSEKQTQLTQLNQAATIAHELLLGEYKSIDWPKLQKDDPIEYLTKKDQFEKYNASLNQIYGAIQQEQAKKSEANQAKLKEFIKDQQKQLTAKLPGWADDKVRSKEYPELVGFLKSEFNVTKEELDGIFDHRFYEMAYDAKRYRELMKKNPKVENKDRTPQKFVKAGTNKGQARGIAQINDLKRNHGKQKGLDSAAALINALATKR